MSNAPNYTPTTGFATDETNQVAGRSTVKTVSLDNELANISASVNGINTNIKLLQRDDGKLKDFLIEPYALSEQTRALITAGGNPRGNWLPATAYAAKDCVQYSGIAYICIASHTSAGVFDVNLWMAISGDGSASASATSAATSATAAAAAATAAATSATNAATSATAASASATNAASSATASANSASAAATNKTATDANVTASGNSATAAANSATNSAASATAAANSASAAAVSESNALAVVAPSIHAAATKSAPADNDEFGFVDSAAAWVLKKLSWGGIKALLASSLGSVFYKADPNSVAFTKTGAGTVSIKAGTKIDVAGTFLTFAADTAVVIPALTGGTDYAIYACTDGTVRADSNWSAPTGYTTGNSRKIGGFHYGLVAAGTTVAGGSFATTGNGKIWVQGDVDDIAGINKYSLWDLKWRPICDPRGMALVGGRLWVDIYLASTDVDTNGTSKAGSNIASGTVLPKIPAAFGGNGTTTYPSLNWWVANELARSQKKRLMWEHEFVEAAFGVTENQSIDATASTYPTTQRNAGYTSKYGIEQASGHNWIWGQDSSAYQDVAGAGSWKSVTGNTGAAGSERGQAYTFGTYGLVRALFGGSRTYGANSGSRASYWSSYPWYSSWGICLRSACDHMISV